MFETLKLRYSKNFVRKDQLQRYASLGAITAEEFKLITGEDYTGLGCYFTENERG